ncbi:MAG: inner membrane-spanning protein YciB [Acinetobacter bohemicus]|jgi:intracellular septation protein|uniref:Inner membrane-spanning protein YciB n=3 Tax=Acinetobacter TaxID=469 RepID=A0A1H3JQ91_9GAMM|nr:MULTISPECIES: inner membrane-spanning protein YciB [Acinetobacter]ENU21424.1 intracellular septation protein A [Acinetobacter bohemicus ANC 3994]KAB0651075.1 septation protein IspZ [Acinetobacter bohemicus]OTG94037.1 septation protein IspZ [Acinetobacter sp. ANC 4654]CAD9195980.1 putative intracellular septation protein A [Acinetobacter bohemicus]SDY42140.1 intracellular septation protein [Acinetobacter kyonggiensis]
MKALLDFVPLIIFFYLYKTVDPKDTEHPLLQLIGSAGGIDNNNILVATSGLIISMLVVYGALFVIQKFRLDKQQWIVLFMTVVFGGITLILSDDFYIRLKAALLNIVFAAAFLLSPYFMKDKKPLIQRLFGPIFNLTEKGWKNLNFAWAAMFALMSCLHIFFAFLFAGGKYWGEFTAFGDMIVMFSFIIIQFIVLRKHFKSPEE